MHQRSPWHDWVLCWPPVPVDSVQVAVAHACVGDLDEHVLGAQRTTRELVGRHHTTIITRSPAQCVGIRGAISALKLQGQCRTAPVERLVTSCLQSTDSC